MIFPPFINYSHAVAPDLPPLNLAPLQVQIAIRHLHLLERNLSDDDSYRFVCHLFSLVSSLISQIPTNSCTHFPHFAFGTARSFTIIKEREDKGILLVHFDKEEDRFTKEYEEIRISPAIVLTTGKICAWIFPRLTSLHHRSTTIEQQLPFIHDFDKPTKGVVNSRIIQSKQGPQCTITALLQDYGICNLREYIYKKEHPFVAWINQQFSTIHETIRIIVFMHTLLRGLSSIHAKGWIHNDVSLSNIVLICAHKANFLHAKFIDFNESIVQEEGEYLLEVLGTHGYLAPEFYIHAEEFNTIGERRSPSFLKEDAPICYTPKKDIWALGQVFHELVFGIRLEPESEAFYELLKHHDQEELAPVLQYISTLRPFGNLIARMLHQNPLYRISAEEAIAHHNQILVTEKVHFNSTLQLF